MKIEFFDGKVNDTANGVKTESGLDNPVSISIIQISSQEDLEYALKLLSKVPIESGYLKLPQFDAT